MRISTIKQNLLAVYPGVKEIIIDASDGAINTEWRELNMRIQVVDKTCALKLNWRLKGGMINLKDVEINPLFEVPELQYDV